MSDLPAQPNQSLIHGLECFQAVVAAGRPVGNRELARLLGADPTRVNRVLKTLAHLQLLERTPQRKYRPGPAVHVRRRLYSIRNAVVGSMRVARCAGTMDAATATVTRTAIVTMNVTASRASARTILACSSRPTGQ